MIQLKRKNITTHVSEFQRGLDCIIMLLLNLECFNKYTFYSLYSQPTVTVLTLNHSAFGKTQTCTPSFVDQFRSVSLRHAWPSNNNLQFAFASLPPPLSLCLAHAADQATPPYAVSSWTCCSSGAPSFANPHPSRLRERRCWKTWWPSMLSWETSTLTTAPQVS